MCCVPPMSSVLWKISPGPPSKCPTSWGFVLFLGFVCASDVPFCFWKISPDPSPQAQTQAANVGHCGGPLSVFFVFPLSLSGRSPLWIVVACASSLVFVFVISLRGSLLFVISRRVSGPALSLLRSIGGVTSREETPAKSVESSGCFVHCLVCVCDGGRGRERQERTPARRDGGPLPPRAGGRGGAEWTPSRVSTHQPEIVPAGSISMVSVDRIRRKVRQGGDSVPAPDLVCYITITE